MTDTFGENDEYIERFVSDIMPETGDGYIKIDCMTATFDKDKFSASFVEYKTKYHSGEDRTIYLIDVKGNGDNVFEMEISFDENARRNGEEK